MLSLFLKRWQAKAFLTTASGGDPGVWHQAGWEVRGCFHMFLPPEVSPQVACSRCIERLGAGTCSHFGISGLRAAWTGLTRSPDNASSPEAGDPGRVGVCHRLVSRGPSARATQYGHTAGTLPHICKNETLPWPSAKPLSLPSPPCPHFGEREVLKKSLQRPVSR